MTRPTLLPLRRSRDGRPSRARALRLASVAALPLAAPVVAAPVAGAATPTTQVTYVVQPGDTLSAIALRFGTDVPTLVSLNRLTNPDVVLAGATLVVPAPVYRAPAPPPTPAPVPPPRPAPRAVAYTVKPGDTIWDIAARTGTTVAAVLAANDLPADAQIRPGQVLLLPGARLLGVPPAPHPKPARVVVVVVQPGDTVSAIAQRYGISVAAVLGANRLGPDAVIRPGQKLVLPGATPRRARRTHAPVTHGYVVRPGDTLSGIAQAAHVPLTAVMALNHLPASAIIHPGQRLLLPGPAPAPAGASTAAVSTAAGSTAAGSTAAGSTAAGSTATGPQPVRAAAAANRAALARRPVPDAAEVAGLVRGAARRYGVDPALALAVADKESGFDQSRVSSANAIGVMQVVPSSGRWASSLVGRRLDLLETADNVVAGVAILAALRAAAPERTAVAAYYQGLSSVRAHGLFDDTRRYVADVLALRERYR